MKFEKIKPKYIIVLSILTLVFAFLTDMQLGSPLFPGRYVEGTVIGTEIKKYGRRGRIDREHTVIEVSEGGKVKKYDFATGFHDWPIGSKVPLKITHIGVAQPAGINIGLGAIVCFLIFLYFGWLTLIGIKQLKDT